MVRWQASSHHCCANVDVLCCVVCPISVHLLHFCVQWKTVLSSLARLWWWLEFLLLKTSVLEKKIVCTWFKIFTNQMDEENQGRIAVIITKPCGSLVVLFPPPDSARYSPQHLLPSKLTSQPLSYFTRCHIPFSVLLIIFSYMTPMDELKFSNTMEKKLRLVKCMWYSVVFFQ